MRWSRKRFLIDPLQYRLLGASLFYFLAICLIFIINFFGPLIEDLEGKPTASLAREDAATAFLYLDSRMWSSLVVLFVLFGVHTVLVSHRIVGPLYRFRKGFQAASEGDLSPISIRKNDYLKREVNSINAMFKTLGARIAEMRQCCDEAQAVLPRLREAAKASGEEVHEQAREIEARINALRDCLQLFKVGSGDAAPQGQAAVEGEAPRDDNELEPAKAGVP